jgi:primase-polymerase (primpol)-like protein
MKMEKEKENLFSNIPVELRQSDCWINWRKEAKKGKPTKVPYQPDNKKAKTDDSETWSTFEKVCSVVDNFSGIGYVFSMNNDYIGIDIDHCATNGMISEEAKKWIAEFDSYTEYSQSGTGIHIIVESDKELISKIIKEKYKTDTGLNRAKGECYIEKRFFVVTGDIYTNHKEIYCVDPDVVISFLEFITEGKIKEAKTEVDDRVRSPQMEDEAILKLASQAKNGENFLKLYNEIGKDGNSNTDLSICNILAFYCQDIEQIKRILRNSPRYRDKFNDHPTYLNMTIEEAIDECDSFYNPNYNSNVNGIVWDKDHIHIGAKGSKSPLLSLSNLRILCKHENIEIKYNEMSHELELNGERVVDRHDYMVKDLTQKHGFKNATISLVAGYIGALGYENRYHPVEDYLNTLIPLNSLTEFEKLLNTITLKNKDDKDYTRLVLKKWLIGCVAAIYDPTFTGQGSFTMQGTGGIFKSRWFSRLSPKKEWFKGEFTGLDVNNKDSVAKVVKYWIVELAELESTIFKDFISLKGFITNEADEYRAPFDRRMSIHKRRTAFCSTVNSQEFLKDDTGDRRFWIVEVEKLDLVTKIDLDRLWAEIKYLFLNGETHYLDSEQTEEVKERNRMYGVKTCLDDVFATIIDYTVEAKLYTSLKLKNLLEAAGYRENGLTTTKISRTLNKLNYKSIDKKVNGVKGRYYKLSINLEKINRVSL